jgi:OmcA/MtrC family decaheme c-type cytochrome
MLMSLGTKASRSLLVFLICVSAAAAGTAAMVDRSPQQFYTVLEKAFYLSAEDEAWIRPGLNLAIQNITIPSDRRPVITYRITDNGGQALDREGKLTPGAVSTSFILAYIPQTSSQYWSYTTRVQTSPITGKSEKQASADSGGAYTSMGDGVYQYRFGTALPADYDQSATHTLGIYGSRNLTEFGMSTYYVNELKSWVPNGSAVTKIRDIAPTTACNQCHDPLALHGGSRQKMELCILCHTPQTIDPDTGNTTDMPVMTHRIHMGKNLPSVIAGKPYQIIGFNQTVVDFSNIGLPMDIRNCTNCHKDTKQVNQWMLNPTRAYCGESCHDNINWTSGAGHPAGPQTSDRLCANCHYPEGEIEYDAGIKTAHTVPYESNQLKKPVLEILSITNTAPGQKPVVKFKVTDKNGIVNVAILTGTAGRLALTLAGPTSDYRWSLQEAANTATMDASGVATYTFAGSIPATATGTYAIQAEGYETATLNPNWPAKRTDYRDAWPNVVKYFAVTGTTVTPRRTVVDLALCNKCHDKLQLHGNNRNTIESCVVCHNPVGTDAARRPAAAKPDESIQMAYMIHKIHTGEEQSVPYIVYGFGGSRNDFSEVLYPGDRRDCLQCHKAGTYTVPLPATATPVTTPRGYWTPTLPTSAACLGCHDSVEAAAHAYTNTASFGEACATCHKESAEVAVSKAHAR